MCQTSVSCTRNATFAPGNTPGRVFGGIKSPCGNGDTHSLGFPHKNIVFSYGKNPGACFGDYKKPLREWGHALPRFPFQKHSF